MNAWIFWTLLAVSIYGAVLSTINLRKLRLPKKSDEEVQEDIDEYVRWLYQELVSRGKKDIYMMTSDELSAWATCDPEGYRREVMRRTTKE